MGEETDRLLIKFQTYLVGRFTKTEMDTITQAFLLAISEYDMKEKSTELIVSEESDLQIVQMFFVAKSVEGCSKKTISYYYSEITKFLTSVNKPIKKITANDIRVYIARIGIEKKICKVTQDNTLRIIKSFFSWLTAEEIIEKNPTSRIRRIRVDKKQKKAFTDIEIEKLRNAAENKRDRALVDFLMSTGCRVSEITRLNKTDIQNDECKVFGKGAKERTVYLNARAIVSLNEYLKEREDTKEALFVSAHKPHNRLKNNSVETIVRKLGEKTNITNVHPHRFRRTAATKAAKRGMPIEQIKQMLGHTEIQTTLIYLDMGGDTLKESHKKYMA